ncbi:MAG: MCE family protein [Kiritimatiellae bacterium]|nr:MCE family protein [Kiritimatiellia bacterium]
MSRKNRDVFSEIIVGIFMLAVLALLAYFTIVISGVDLLMGRAKTTGTFVFRDVGGLKERDSVMYRGMKVGAVERIELGASNITVRVKVDSDVTMRETGKASVSALSLLGGNYLLLEEGTGAPKPLETTVFHGEPPVDWMRDLGEIARNLSDLTSDGSIRNIVTNFEEAAKNLNKIVARVERGEGTVGNLLSADNTLYGDLTSTVVRARQTFDSAAAISARLEKGEGTLGKLLSKDEAAYGDITNAVASIKETFAHAATLAERLDKGEGTLGRLLAKDDALWGDLTNTVANIRATSEKLKSGEGLLGKIMDDKELADNATKLMENLKAVSDKLAKGEGTLGKLTTDQEMYDEVNGLIKDVRQIVDNYRDTTPISTFGSLIMGGL